MQLTMDLQVGGIGDRCIVDAMIDQAPSLGLSEAEADDHIQEVAINLLLGMW